MNGLRADSLWGRCHAFATPNTIPKPGRVGWALMVGWAFVACCPFAPAQPALQNAVLNDRGVASRQREREASFQEVQGVEAGPVRVSISGSYSLEFNDNINTSESNPSGDLIHVPAVTLGILVPLSQRSDLSFRIGVGYRAYWHNEDLSRIRIAPGSELAYDLKVKDVFISLFNRFSYTDDVTTAPDVTGLEQFPRLENTIGTQVTWIPDRVLVVAGYSYRVSLSTEDAFDYFNRASHLPFLRAGYVFAEGAANSGLEFSVTLTDYESNLTSDSSIVSFGPYLEWQLSDAIEAALRGGFLYVANSITLLPEESFDTDSFYLGLDVGHELTDNISHGLTVNHGVRPSYQRGLSFTEQTGVNYQIAWAFTDPAAFSLGMGYLHAKQAIAAGAAPSETYDQWRLRVSVSYEVTARLSGAVAYDYIMRDSDQSGRDYTQNRVTLGLSYRFE